MPDNESAITDGSGFGWRIERCDHGCIHIHMGRTTVSLTAEEFVAFRHLLASATVEWSRATPPRRVRPH